MKIGGQIGRPLEGIIPPMVTPLAGRDQLDEAGLERLVDRLLTGGVHGLFILGTSGEAPNLSYRLRQNVVHRVCKQVGGRIPVLVGITDTSFVEAVSMARYAADAGADALVTAAPYYFPAGQPELEDFIRTLVPELPLPVYLYNMPQMTKVQFEPELIRRIADFKQIVGLKDSSGDLSYYRELLNVARARSDWRVLIGPEHLLVDSMRMGGHGGVNGGAQIAPDLFVGLFNAVRANNVQLTIKLQKQLAQLGQIYRIGQHASAVIKGMKCALSLLGVCNDQMAEPFKPFSLREREMVRQVLADLALT